MMSPAIIISILGAFSAILVSMIGAWFANRNNIMLQTRKLKEDHYIAYLESLHNLAADNSDKEITQKYVFARDKLFLIASEDVIIKMLLFENEGVGNSDEIHNNHLTELIKSIRRDLKIADKHFPTIYLRKANKQL